MQHNDDTIVACATAQGLGAISVIRLSGPQALSICNAAFHSKNLEAQTANTVHFGTLRKDGRIIDEVLATLFHGPHSYTGEHVVEVSTHGSPYIVTEVLNLFIELGARAAGPGEFTQRAFLNGKLDLSQAEAVADLIASESKSAHRVAMQQMRGGFSDEIKRLREQLLNFASLIELELDFSEEDVEFANRDELVALIQRIRTVTQALIGSFRVGNAIRNGIPVVIAGKPNAGKSTLLNALLNEERAIVSDIAGTTRDTIEEELNLGGISFRFIDTAGIRDTQDEIEVIGVRKTLEKIRSSAIVLYLFDVNTMSPEELRTVVDQLREEMDSEDASLLLLGNKIDLDDAAALRARYSGFEHLHFISAREQEGIATLSDALVEAVGLNAAGNDTIITNTRHVEALSKSDEALDRALVGLHTGLTGDFLAQDIRMSLHYLGEITGEVTTDDVLGNIFSKFCIGK